MYVVGGTSYSIPVRLFCYDDQTKEWRDLSKRGDPMPRNNFIYHASTLAADGIIVLGRKGLDRLWKFDVVLEEWVHCECISDAGLSNIAMVFEYLDHRNECIQFGGKTMEPFTALSDEINAIRLDEWRWYKPQVKGRKPGGFSNMASCVVGTTIYIFGGQTSVPASNDLHLLHCAGHGAVVWSCPEVLGAKPLPRYNATITNLFCGKLLVIGGYYSTFHNDMWIYSIADKTWTDLLATGGCEGPIPRISQHGSAYFGRRLIVIGRHDYRLVNGYAVLEGVK